MTTQQLVDLLVEGIRQTAYMTLISTLMAYAIGLPLGVVLTVTDVRYRTERLAESHPRSGHQLLARSPLSDPDDLDYPSDAPSWARRSVQKQPSFRSLSGAAPYIARMVESSLKEVSTGVIEAARSMGASTLQLVTKVLLPEARPSLLIGCAISMTTILGYSTMAGFIGGGGLGALAINYGYNRYNTDVMTITVVLMAVIVQIIQIVGSWITRKSDKRL